MDDDGPMLEVGFAIETAGSFEHLRQLEAAIGSTEARVVAEAAKIEKATAGMVNVGGATAQITAFGNAATRELRDAARAKAQVERAGESLVRQLDREAAAVGKTKDELRALRAEGLATSAAQQGNLDLAQRIRAAEQALYDQKFAAARRATQAAEAAAEEEARAAARATAAMTAETNAAERLAREHAELANAVRGSHAAQLADAAAAERLRAATDPLYAATSRLNAEIAESTRLYLAGATAPAEYARQQEVLTGRLRDVQEQHAVVNRGIGTVGETGKLAGHHMQNLAFQFQDLSLGMGSALGSSEPLKMMMMTLAQQGMQIQGIMSQAGIGVRGVGAAFGSMAKNALLAAATNPYVIAFGAAAAFAVVGFKDLQKTVEKDSGMAAYAKSVGLTKDELKKLGSTSVSVGDMFKGLWKTFGELTEVGTMFGDLKDAVLEKMRDLVRGTGREIASIYGFFVGAYDAIIATWNVFPAALGDLFIQAVNKAVDAINWLIQKSVAGINWMIDQANKVLPAFAQISSVSAGTIGGVANQWAGAANGAGEKAGKAFNDGFARGQGQVNALGKQIYDNIVGANRDRVKGEIAKILAERGGKGGSPKAQQLSEEEKAYRKALEAANDYIATVEKETARIGKSAKEIRLMEDAVARANAPLAEQKKRIDEVAAARETAYGKQAAADFQQNVMQPLRDELALWGLVGPARDAAALSLEKQAFIAQHIGDGIDVATARWEEYYKIKRELIDKDSAAELEADRIRRMREEMDSLVDTARSAGDAIARAFGNVGSSIADAIDIITEYQKRQSDIDERLAADKLKQAEAAKLSASLQIQSMGALAGAAKGFFKEHSTGYQAMVAAEKAFAIIQLANTAKNVAAGAANMFAQLGPFAFPAVAAMLGVMAGLGFFGGGSGGNAPAPANEGRGTVFGDPKAQSESIKRAIDQLKEVDTVMLTYSREMAASLRSIDSQVGGFAAVILRSGDINASEGVAQGFKPNAIGSILGAIPLVGGLLKSLFGTTTTVIGSGLYGGPQSIASILGGGFDASTYSDIERKKKFLGITTGKSYSTQYGAADPALEGQFTLILRSFYDAISAAAGPLGLATSDIQQRLNSFVVNIGKIDLKGLTGEQISEKLSAIFGAAADQMAAVAFPGFQRFQLAGEGMFETLVRVASTVETVTASLDQLGLGTRGLGIDAKLGLADQFESLSKLTSATDSYFKAYYTREEQAAASAAQFAKVFQSLGLSMPSSLSAFRALVEAQDLTTAAGQATYATLLQLAPAFAELQNALAGAKSAADVMAERQDLERRMLELQGNTAALRALDLAKLDASNRALQQQIWALQDAQEAARAAAELRKAWTSVGDGIMDEVRRIRGLSGIGGEGSFATLMGQFNAATTAARGGDIEAAKKLPGLSQAMLAAAEKAATSRQELDRIRAQTASTLESLAAAINGANPSTGGTPAATLLQNMADVVSIATSASSDATATELRTGMEGLREELAQMRKENASGHAATAGNTGAIKRHLENVTADSGGTAISTRAA